MIVSAIAAVAANRVIGKDNDLVWSLPDDMRFFQQTTTGHHIVMGRKNYESLPAKWQPLPNRTNIVVTRQKDLRIEGVLITHSVQEALDLAREAGETEVFIIGGGEIYEISMPLLDRMYCTEIHSDFEGDTYFPAFDKSEWKEVSRDFHPIDDRHAHSFDFVIYERSR